MKKVVGWIFIACLAAVDFTLVQSLILESNSTPIAAFLGALLFCVGLEGGPTFLGMGLIEFFDKTRIRSGTGKLKSIIYMVVGGLSTLVSFSGYLYVRRDAIITLGGVGGAHYDGFYGDLILMLTPFLTSFLAFGISLWISTHGIDAVAKEAEKAQKDYDVAFIEKRNAENEFVSALVTIWNRHFPDADMPTDNEVVIDRIKGSISCELESRLEILLPQILNETNLIIPFTNSLREHFKNSVDDPQYLSMVEIAQFDMGTSIGDAREVLKENTAHIINKIINTVSNKRVINYEKSA